MYNLREGGLRMKTLIRSIDPCGRSNGCMADMHLARSAGWATPGCDWLAGTPICGSESWGSEPCPRGKKHRPVLSFARSTKYLHMTSADPGGVRFRLATPRLRIAENAKKS